MVSLLTPKFDEHINNLCKNACQKSNAQPNNFTLFEFSDISAVMGAFAISQFEYRTA